MSYLLGIHSINKLNDPENFRFDDLKSNGGWKVLKQKSQIYILCSLNKFSSIITNLRDTMVSLLPTSLVHIATLVQFQLSDQSATQNSKLAHVWWSLEDRLAEDLYDDT